MKMVDEVQKVKPRMGSVPKDLRKGSVPKELCCEKSNSTTSTPPMGSDPLRLIHGCPTEATVLQSQP